MNNSISLGGSNQERWSFWYCKVVRFHIVKVNNITVVDDVINNSEDFDMQRKCKEYHKQWMLSEYEVQALKTYFVLQKTYFVFDKQLAHRHYISGYYPPVPYSPSDFHTEIF